MQEVKVDKFPTHVEFRRRGPAGVLVVRVMLHLTTPRVSFYTEDLHEIGTILPASMFIDELLEFVEQAKKILSSNPTRY